MKKTINALLLLSFISSYSAVTNAAPNPPIFLGYWENWGTYDHFPMVNNAQNKPNPTLSGQLTKINALAYAFLEVAPNGVIQFYDTYSDLNANSELDNRFCKASPESCNRFPRNAGLGNFSAFANVPLTYHIVSVGGANHDRDWENAFNNPDKFVTSLKLLVDTYHIQGLDIDYEPSGGIPRAYLDKFINLTTKIKQSMPDLILSYPIMANYQNIKRLGKTNWQRLKLNLNYISVMGYEMHGPYDSDRPYTALQSPLMTENTDGYSDDSAIAALNSMGIPNSMIILGMPLHGVAVGGVEREGLGQRFTQSVRGDIDDDSRCSVVLNSNNMCEGTFKYKTLTDSNYLPTPVIQKGMLAGVYTYDRYKKIFVSYESPESASAKTTYAINNKLAGVMVWALRFDQPVNDPRSLIGAISKTLDNTNRS